MFKIYYPGIRLEGLTLLNLIALSGVVSGQSSSKTMGFFFASSSCLISSSVNISLIVLIFSIIQPRSKLVALLAEIILVTALK